MTFARRKYLEKKILFHKTLYKYPTNILEHFLNNFSVVLEHSYIKLKTYSRIVPDHFAGVHKYSRNINLLTYVNLTSVHMTYFAQGV